MLTIHVLTILKHRCVVRKFLVCKGVACYLLISAPDTSVLNLVKVILCLGGINSGVGRQFFISLITVIETKGINSSAVGVEAGLTVAGAYRLSGRGFAVVVIPRVRPSSR